VTNYNFIKLSKRIPLKDLKLVKRPDGGFRKHPSNFFKRNCLDKFESKCIQYLADKSNIEIETLKQFMAGNLSVDSTLAKKLEKATKVDAATWLELQRQYDEYIKSC
jgi:plasmid maintenance system antidote protein VapI